MKTFKWDTSLRSLFSFRRATRRGKESSKAINVSWMGVAIAVPLSAVLGVQTLSAQEAKPFKDFNSYVSYVAKNHKAPFDRDGAVIPPAASKALAAKHTKAAA